jgi:pimeloyl-ACP methyl ester carboxylesterase
MAKQHFNMNESAYFMEIPANGGRRLFTYTHYPSSPGGDAFLMLDPLFDEKKKVHGFLVNTARQLCRLGYLVMRFDYYGTGDSEGEHTDMNLEESVSDAIYLHDHLISRHHVNKVNLLGVRFGADMAAMISGKIGSVTDLYLVEPLVNGSRFLFEQRLRKKISYKMKMISEQEDQFFIDGREYEDFQGFPLSAGNLAFLDNLQTENIGIQNKRIHLFTVSMSASQEKIIQFGQALAIDNEVHNREAGCISFWFAFKMIDTQSLTDQILNLLT